MPNVLFIQAAVENLPEELNAAANEIHIHFPWGSLLRAVVSGDETVFDSLRRICALECLFEIVIGIDEERDKSEIERLELSQLSSDYLADILVPKYEAAGFKFFEKGVLDSFDWSKLETSWARKLKGGGYRKIVYFILQASTPP